MSTVAVRISALIHVRQTAASRVCVVLAEDDLLLREGLASLLERSGFRRGRAGGDGSQLLAIVRETTPDLVVTRYSHAAVQFHRGTRCGPGHSRRVAPHTQPSSCSRRMSEVEHEMELLAGGRGIGYLLKSRVTDVADFIETLQRVAKGAAGGPRTGAGAGVGATARRPAGGPHRANRTYWR
jgi:DNA-binding NarL/FixJ family response regulator